MYDDYNICSNLQIEGEGPQTNLVETGTYWELARDPFVVASLQPSSFRRSPQVAAVARRRPATQPAPPPRSPAGAATQLPSKRRYPAAQQAPPPPSNEKRESKCVCVWDTVTDWVLTGAVRAI
jgi:hypothetical protein